VDKDGSWVLLEFKRCNTNFLLKDFKRFKHQDLKHLKKEAILKLHFNPKIEKFGNEDTISEWMNNTSYSKSPITQIREYFNHRTFQGKNVKAAFSIVITGTRKIVVGKYDKDNECFSEIVSI
jgi:hypothetical protein